MYSVKSTVHKLTAIVLPIALVVLWAAGADSVLLAASPPATSASGRPQQAGQAGSARQVGTVKAITGNTIVLTTASGDVTVVVQDNAPVLRVEPGQKDLSGAATITLNDLQVGDRILVRGQNSTDAKSFSASSVIAMKHADVEAKQQQEREDWQKHGIGGLVSSVDPAAGIVTINAGAAGTARVVVIQVTKDTVIRRYAPDSVKFDDAKPGSFDAIKPGDQLRARGIEGRPFQAQEIVTGSFRNIAGTVSSVDTGAETILMMDAITKHPVTVRITHETQVRKLPPEVAQRIALRFKAPGANSAANSGPQAGGQQANPGAEASGGSAPNRLSPDLQQLLARVPTINLSDLQKGDAVMIVSTQSDNPSQATAITLLAGVEPILIASPRDAEAMLSPWSLGGEGDADATP